jgi:hypothetical protein
VEEQWYEIWGILFPGIQRPCSPYIDHTLFLDISSFQNFYTVNGPSVLREVLQENGLGITGEQQYHDAVLSAGLTRILNGWLANQAEHRTSATDDTVTGGTVSPATYDNIDTRNSHGRIVEIETDSNDNPDLTTTEAANIAEGGDIEWACDLGAHSSEANLWDDLEWFADSLGELGDKHLVEPLH